MRYPGGPGRLTSRDRDGRRQGEAALLSVVYHGLTVVQPGKRLVKTTAQQFVASQKRSAHIAVEIVTERHNSRGDTMGEQLWSALQPIVDTDTGRIVAHEALLRGPQGTPWESPGALFAAAARLGHQVILEANARRLAIQRLSDLPSDQRLFVNIDAMVPDMPAAPRHPDILVHRIVLEISERQPIIDNPALWDQVSTWREAGSLPIKRFSLACSAIRRISPPGSPEIRDIGRRSVPAR